MLQIIKDLMMPMEISNMISLLGIALPLCLGMAALWMESRGSRIAREADVMLNLDARFYSAEMREMRQVAAKKIIDSNLWNHELSDVLDFLTTIALMARSKAINRKLADQHYNNWIVGYWLAGQEYISLERNYSAGNWEALELHAKKLINNRIHTPEYISAFLHNEMRSEHPSPRPSIRSSNIRGQVIVDAADIHTDRH